MRLTKEIAMKQLISALLGFSFLIMSPVSAMGQTHQPISDPQVANLRKELEQMKATIKDLADQLSKTKTDLAFFKFENGPKTWVLLDPTTPHVYSRVDTSNGFFLVSVEEATPYLDGYRVVLNIGNPLSARYSQFTVKAKWNKRYDWSKYTEASLAAWNASEKSKDTDVTQALEPGAWNRVTIILSPAAGDQLGYLTVS